MDDRSPPFPVLTDACDGAMQAVEHGFDLIDAVPADDRVLVALETTKEAIDTALAVCKAEQPEARLKRLQHTIEQQIERMEEAIIPMPRIPAQPRRRRSNAYLA